MKSICIITAKGGTGKSFLSFNVGGYLAKQGYKVLLTDCDAQGNLSENCGVNSDEYEFDSIADIFESQLNKKDILPSNIVIKSPIAELPTMDLLPSDISLTMTEMRLVSNTTRYKMLQNYIDKHRSFFDKYDYMILDCNPSFNIINQNAMYVADSIVTITDIGRNSFKGVKLVCQLWQETCDDLGIENTIKGMVINKYDKTIKLSKEFMFFIEDNEIFKKLAFDTVIPDNVKLKETEIVSLPIVIHHTKNQGYKAFMELMEEFKQREII